MNASIKEGTGMVRLVVVLISCWALTACDHSVKPVTTAGACGIFDDPGFEVKGETRKDQRWISGTQETGIAHCGWKRPTE